MTAEYKPKNPWVGLEARLLMDSNARRRKNEYEEMRRMALKSDGVRELTRLLNSRTTEEVRCALLDALVGGAMATKAASETKSALFITPEAQAQLQTIAPDWINVMSYLSFFHHFNSAAVWTGLLEPTSDEERQIVNIALGKTRHINLAAAGREIEGNNFGFFVAGLEGVAAAVLLGDSFELDISSRPKEKTTYPAIIAMREYTKTPAQTFDQTLERLYGFYPSTRPENGRAQYTALGFFAKYNAFEGVFSEGWGQERRGECPAVAITQKILREMGAILTDLTVEQKFRDLVLK